MEQWNSHGVPVKGFAALLFNQFIILLADETDMGVSGCSTDSSVRLIKDIEQMFNVNLFDRQMLAFIIKDKVQLLPLGQLKYAADNHFISANTLYFNNLVQTKLDFESNWIIPIKDSWLTRRRSWKISKTGSGNWSGNPYPRLPRVVQAAPVKPNSSVLDR